MARAVQIPAAEALADKDRRGHAEAEDEGHEQEHDQIGIGGGGERLLPEEAADPDRVHRTVERLDDRGEERRQREAEQSLADRAGCEIALARARRHQPSLARAARYFSASETRSS